MLTLCAVAAGRVYTELARKEAMALTEDDPTLTKEPNRYIRPIIQKRYPTYLRDVKAG